MSDERLKKLEAFVDTLKTPLEKLEAALTQGLGIDLVHPGTDKKFKPEEVAKLAETFCALSFKPAEFYRKGKNKVEVNTNTKASSLMQEEYDDAMAIAYQGDVEEEADGVQALIGKILAEAYEHGDATLKLSRDPWKARKYGRVDKLPKDYKPDYLKGPRALQKNQWAMSDVYLYLGWFTSFRLFFVRINRIMDYFNDGFLVNRVVDVGSEFGNVVINSITKNLKDIAFWASLSYAIELVFDLGVMIRTAFFPTKEEKQHNPDFLSRVANTFAKGDRMPRMVNAAVWFSINLACYFVAPLLAAILNLTLFAFDVIPDVYKYYRDKWKYDNLLTSIGAKIENLTKQIEQIEKQSEKEGQVVDLNACNVLKRNVIKLERIQARLQKDKENTLFGRKKALIVTCMILAGMTILLVPQFAAAACLSILAVKITAAVVAMLGSVIGGLGNRLWQKTKEKLNPAKPEISQEEYAQLMNEKYLERVPSILPLQGSSVNEVDFNKPKQISETTRAALMRRFRELNALPVSQSTEAALQTAYPLSSMSFAKLRECARNGHPVKQVQHPEGTSKRCLAV